MSLVRAGVKKIRIVDFDLVSISSLNRHAFALRKNVGSSKVQTIADYCKKINPSIEVEVYETLLHKSN